MPNRKKFTLNVFSKYVLKSVAILDFKIWEGRREANCTECMGAAQGGYGRMLGTEHPSTKGDQGSTYKNFDL